ncbi:unnamed protein product [Calypogeia fissa]
MERRTEPVETLDNERLTFSEACGDTLLPGIPNEVTMAQIVPILSWKDFYILSSVSPAWCNAIRSRRVYNARVRSCSTETLVLVRYVHYSPRKHLNPLLYSMKDDSCYELPHIPPLPLSSRLIKYWSTSVSMDGKVYVMEVWTEFDSVVVISRSFNRVCVLDVAGQRQWQECANMPITRERFGCGVLDGKIYTFGGRAKCGSAVFDPKENMWSRIKPMASSRYDDQVSVMGDKLFVHGGHMYLDGYLDDYAVMPSANTSEVYHPTRDEWTVVEHFQRQLGEDKNETVFMAQGKFYSLSDEDMHVYDFESRAWTYLQSFSFAKIGPVHYRTVVLVAVLAVDDELVAFADVVKGKKLQRIIIRSEGLRAKKIDIVWREARIPSKIWPRCVWREFLRGACMAVVYL